MMYGGRNLQWQFINQTKGAQFTNYYSQKYRFFQNSKHLNLTASIGNYLHIHSKNKQQFSKIQNQNYNTWSSPPTTYSQHKRCNSTNSHSETSNSNNSTKTTENTQIFPPFTSQNSILNTLKSQVTEWKSLFSTKHWKQDMIAGITTPSIAIPVSLGAALTSGVPVYWGLTSAIVGAVICSLFGSSRFVISGPATGMAIVVYTIVQHSGLEGLIAATVFTGVLQVLTGIFGFGTILKCTPLPVIWGFSSGLGALIFQRQFQNAFNLSAPISSLTDNFNIEKMTSSMSSAINLINEIAAQSIDLFSSANPNAITISMITLFACIYGTKKYPRYPIAIMTLGVFTALQMIHFSFFPSYPSVPILGNIPDTFPALQIPSFENVTISNLMYDTILLYFMASIQAMLSISAIDKIAKIKHPNNPPSNTNQDFIGQGFGNIGCSLFNTLPMTGLVVQSTLNIMSGAQTRKSGLIHAATLTSCIYILASTMKFIPLSSLSAVLMSVALTMIKFSDFKILFKIKPIEAMIWLITFGSVFSFGIMVGTAVGVSCSLASAFSLRLRSSPLFFSFSHSGYLPSSSLSQFQPIPSSSLLSSSTSSSLPSSPSPSSSSSSSSSSSYQSLILSTRTEDDDVIPVVRLVGGMTFLSALTIESLKTSLFSLSNANRGIIIDLRDVSFIDVTAGEQLAIILLDLRSLYPSSFFIIPPLRSREVISFLSFDQFDRFASSLLLPPSVNNDN